MAFIGNRSGRALKTFLASNPGASITIDPKLQAFDDVPDVIRVTRDAVEALRDQHVVVAVARGLQRGLEPGTFDRRAAHAGVFEHSDGDVPVRCAPIAAARLLIFQAELVVFRLFVRRYANPKRGPKFSLSVGIRFVRRLAPMSCAFGF